MPDRATGPWQDRVRFGPNGTFAYRPGEVLVNAEVAEQAHERLLEWQSETDEGMAVELDDSVIADAYVRFTGNFETHGAIERLHQSGLLAQPNHVLFATGCCPPHPSDPEAKPFYANPFYANPFYANPFYANPFYANPFYANPFGQCGCCQSSCSCSGASANPFYANPFYANPFYANADTSPFSNRAAQHSGARSSSARPAQAPQASGKQAVGEVRVVILDTGWAETHTPTGLPNINVSPQGGDQPDEDGDGFLDPAAGHGTFIAGLIEQFAPGCAIEIAEVLSTYGDGDEVEIANAVSALARRGANERPHLVNLSFGGYSPMGMGALTKAISALQQEGTVVVAAAGNDATCLPLFPAVIEGVVGVGALDANTKEAATFTNYGPWVRACSWGVDLVSLFFENFNGAGPPEANYDPDDFQGWARWSGTSFATPMVVAALAQVIGGGVSPRDAVDQLIDDKSLPRSPMLGTIVDPTK